MHHAQELGTQNLPQNELWTILKRAWLQRIPEVLNINSVLHVIMLLQRGVLWLAHYNFVVSALCAAYCT